MREADIFMLYLENTHSSTSYEPLKGFFFFGRAQVTHCEQHYDIYFAPLLV